MLHKAQSAVHEFHRLFGVPFSNSPMLLASDRVEARIKWMQEELEELRAATDIVDQADAIADVIYFALGAFVEMGLDGGTVFALVHDSNISKLGPNGELSRDIDGKIVKPQGWTSPKQRIRQWLEEHIGAKE